MREPRLETGFFVYLCLLFSYSLPILVRSVPGTLVFQKLIPSPSLSLPYSLVRAPFPPLSPCTVHLSCLSPLYSSSYPLPPPPQFLFTFLVWVGGIPNYILTSRDSELGTTNERACDDLCLSGPCFFAQHNLSSSTHLLVNFMISCLFIPGQHSVVCTRHIFIIRSSAGGRLGHLHCLAFVNRKSMSMAMDLPMEKTAGTLGHLPRHSAAGSSA